MGSRIIRWRRRWLRRRFCRRLGWGILIHRFVHGGHIVSEHDGSHELRL